MIKGHKLHKKPVWLFDLDNTLHDARQASFASIDAAMTTYIAEHLQLDVEQADYLRHHYWQCYGATVTGLVCHHGIDGAHFLYHTHLLPGLEERLVLDAVQLGVIQHLSGVKWVYTNGPHAYAKRILKAAKISDYFAGVWAMEESLIQGRYHPKPSTDALSHLLKSLKVSPEQCILVDDSLANLLSAKSLGIKGIWMRAYHGAVSGENDGLHHRKALQQQEGSVDATIDRLDELLQVEERFDIHRASL